ncbi:MAG: hypothetical protein D4Q77_02600 [Methanothrix sp.]|nr:MAG: hypothetical protein D4Q77_02600 [Methanothrix sp.]
MSYYECNVRSLPEGSDSPSRLALVARRLGYSGLIICNRSTNGPLFGADAAEKIDNIDVARGVELVASNPRALHSRTAALRARFDFLVVCGGPEKIDRAACEDPKVDLLLRPQERAKRLGIAAARAARDNQVATGIDLGHMIHLRGGARTRWAETVHQDLKLIRKFDLGLMITAGPRSHLDLRAPRELIALAGMVGLEDYEAKEALCLPETILGLNRRRWAGPGVEML